MFPELSAERVDQVIYCESTNLTLLRTLLIWLRQVRWDPGGEDTGVAREAPGGGRGQEGRAVMGGQRDGRNQGGLPV